MEKTISLSDMKSGGTGTVARIRGGHGALGKLENMGIRPGVKIKKVSQQFLKGPVIIRIGNTQAAMGCGMSNKILVDPD